MKKLIATLMVALFAATGAFAQTPAVKQVPAQKTTVKTTTVKKHETHAAKQVKKDGTPDMRFKTNKEGVKAKPAGPLKKDGTADMRYKANKKK